MEEDNYSWVSFKEFIARVIAIDFDAPDDNDWKEAENIMNGGKNFILGKGVVDTTIYKELEYLDEYILFMENPNDWVQYNEKERYSDCMIAVEELIKDLIILNQNQKCN